MNDVTMRLRLALASVYPADEIDIADVRTLLDSVDALTIDANRYRYLRNDSPNGSRHDPAVLLDGPTDDCKFADGEILDEIVDAAIAAKAKP